MAVFDPSFPKENLTQLTKIRDVRTLADMRRVGNLFIILKRSSIILIFIRDEAERENVAEVGGPEKGRWVVSEKYP